MLLFLIETQRLSLNSAFPGTQSWENEGKLDVRHMLVHSLTTMREGNNITSNSGLEQEHDAPIWSDTQCSRAMDHQSKPIIFFLSY